MQSAKEKIMTINFSKKWIKISLHILVWVVLITLPYIVNVNRSRPPRPLNNDEETQFLRLNFINYFYLIAVFYLNNKVLIPSFFYKKRYVWYGLLFIGCLLLSITIHSILFRILLPDLNFNLGRTLWFNTPSFLLTIAASTAFTMISDRIKEEKRSLQREQENMKTELSFLRSQISPHFIFNVLNNIVALVRLKSNELEPTVMKLSGLMQYMLYETDEEKVSIKTETEYLQAYIDLQEQRFGKKVAVKANIEIESEFDEIEPMLLIPFIENAFKHGVAMIESPEIFIDLKTEDEFLTFVVRNKFNKDQNEIKDGASGIGLANVSLRLNLLYGKNHHLEIEKENGWFNVNLSLKLTV
ncbi:sensor histidine kinase [Pedobacter zeae]|uniref:Histidine kinase n=1 Tax=Pedobacter zeae TaxID=1737356 RepID=A0A7W6P5N2_9SPHI|nr:histidine kinase [Pedobacter zeae]MBB4107151.1 sensor histidine kinase YesM [Pedobacter zeae]GGH06027.1 histidine kinase [Pedobacter zeae]